MKNKLPVSKYTYQWYKIQNAGKIVNNYVISLYGADGNELSW